MISKFTVGIKTLLREGLSKPEFYGDLVYKLKKNYTKEGMIFFSFQFRKIIMRYRRVGYNFKNIMRQSACLVFNPIMVDKYAAFINCTLVGPASDSVMAPTLSYSYLLLGLSGLNWCFSFAPVFSKSFGDQGSPSPGSLLNLSPRFLFIMVVIMICLSLMIH